MDTPPRSDSAEPPKALIAALKRLLAPLVRLLLGHGVTYVALIRILKSVYVDVADRHFRLDERPQSDSRISLLTGVHRKDVRMLRSQPADAHDPPESVTMGSAVIARWVAEKRYLDADGRPRELPRRRTRGPSFDALAASVSRQDVKPRVVLDELLRLGLVEITEQDRVRLKVEAFVPEHGIEEKFYYFGRNVADHVAAGAHNLQGDAPKYMERAVSYHNLRESDIETLRALSEQLGMETLKELNKKAIRLQKRSESKPQSDQRMSFGTYFYSEVQVAEDDEPKSEPKPDEDAP